MYCLGEGWQLALNRSFVRGSQTAWSRHGQTDRLTHNAHSWLTPTFIRLPNITTCTLIKHCRRFILVLHFFSKLEVGEIATKMAAVSTQRTLILIVVLFSVFVAITKSRQQDSFYFDPAPINKDVIEGESVKLRCDVSNRKHIAFYWTLNDRPVSNTSRRYQKDSDLWILRVSRDDDIGSFRCIATNVTTGVSLRSTEARINILCKYNISVVIFLQYSVILEQ